MRSEICERILKSIPLETRLKVGNEMAFINLIVELGYREDRMWSDEEDELLTKLMDLAKQHTDDTLKEIESWKEDGCPE